MKRVALGLHARLVEAVAPRGVLERVLADRRSRSPGASSTPRPRRPACGPATSPCASASPQCSTRRRRPAARVGARRRRRRRARPGPSCASRRRRRTRAVLERRARPPRPARRAGATPVPSRTRSAGSPRRRQRARASAARSRSTSAPSADLDAAPRTASAVMQLAGALAQALAPAGAPRARRASTSSAAARQRRRRLAGDEAGADDHRAARPAAPRARRRRASSTVRIVCTPGSSAPAHGRALRAPSRWRARSASYAQLPAALERARRARAVELHRAVAAPHRRRRAPRTSRASSSAQLAALELAAQELLGQRRAAVGQVRLGATRIDVRPAAGLAVAARGGERGRAAADDDDPRVAPHAPNDVEAVAVVGARPRLPRSARRSRSSAWTSSPRQRIDASTAGASGRRAGARRAPARRRSPSSAASSVGRVQ